MSDTNVYNAEDNILALVLWDAYNALRLNYMKLNKLVL